MKSTYFALSLFLSASSLSVYCSAQHKDSRIRPVVPYAHPKLSAPPGMVYVPGGTTLIKYSQQPTDSNSVKKVSIGSYFIDKTEVTNQQYRQFIEWVVDSIAITKYLKDEEKLFKSSKDNIGTAEVKAGDSTNPAAPVAPANQKRINWARVDHKSLFENDDYKEKLKPMMDEKGQIKKDSIMFSFRYLKANNASGKFKAGTYATETVSVYPDQEIWAKDFPNAQTDILVENYFTSEPYEDYPVVGVTWTQARAFTYWRSQNANSFNNVADYMKNYHLSYSLPSEAQWVYAAQQDMRAIAKANPDAAGNESDGKKGKKKKKGQEAANDSVSTAAVNTDPNSSWTSTAAKTVDNTPVAKNDSNYFNDAIGVDEINSVPSDRKGLTANFKQDEGDYTGDGSPFTLPVMSYSPNDFGIYNMSGNVAEWTMDAYSPSAFAFVSDLNPVLLYDANDSTDGEAMRRKVVRGGSFNSPAKELSAYARAFEMQNTAHSFIGFRCVMGAPEILNSVTATRKKSKKK